MKVSSFHNPLPTRDTAPVTVNEARVYLRDCVVWATERADYWKRQGWYHEQEAWKARVEAYEHAISVLEFVECNTRRERQKSEMTDSPSEPAPAGAEKSLQDRHPNFRADNGRFFLVRCFACEPERGRENWGPAAASGTCAWCGWCQ